MCVTAAWAIGCIVLKKVDTLLVLNPVYPSVQVHVFC